MKIVLRRSQPKDGKFIVVFKLVVSDEEIALFKKHRKHTVLLGHIDGIWSGKTASEFHQTCGFETDDVIAALAVERKVMSDLKALKDYLDAAASYTGDSEFTV